MTKSSYRIAMCLLGIIIGGSRNLAAQQLATLNIAVIDPIGSAISGARIVVRNLETGASRTELSTTTGLAVIPSLPPGDYTLTVESSQFSSYKARITLNVGQSASVSVTLG